MSFDLAAWTADLQRIPEHEFVPAMQAMFAEKDRRAAAPVVAARVAEIEAQVAEERAAVMEQLAEVLPETDPPTDGQRQWRPWNLIDRSTWYLHGDVVVHEGRRWRSLVDPDRRRPNVWIPGVDPGCWEPLDTTVDGDTQGAPDSAEDVNSPTDADDQGDDTPLEWASGTAYSKGFHVAYQGVVYEVLRWHIAQSWRTPDEADSLYAAV